MEPIKKEAHTLLAVAKGFLHSWPLLLQSGVMGLLGILFWEFFHGKLHCYFGILKEIRTVDDLGSDLISFTPAMIYTTLAAFSINRVMGQNSKLKSAIATLNAQMFLEERDRRTLSLVHVFMICVASLILIMLCLYTYSTVELARFVIGTFGFLASFIFLMSVELDNPFTGVWKIQDSRTIPKGWMTMTIYDILQCRVEHIGNPHFPETNQVAVRNPIGSTDDMG